MMSRATSILTIAVVAGAFALGAVGLYAHERTVTPASSSCPPGTVETFQGLAAQEKPRMCKWTPWQVTPHAAGEFTKPVVISASGFDGPIGRDAAPYWWYGAASFLALGLTATLVLRPR